MGEGSDVWMMSSVVPSFRYLSLHDAVVAVGFEPPANPDLADVECARIPEVQLKPEYGDSGPLDEAELLDRSDYITIPFQ